MVLSASPQSRIVKIIFDKAWSTKWPVTSGGHPHSDLNAQETWAKKICWIRVACLANWVFFIVKGPVPVLYCYRRGCCGCCRRPFANPGLTHNHASPFLPHEHRNFKLAGDTLLEMCRSDRGCDCCWGGASQCNYTMPFRMWHTMTLGRVHYVTLFISFFIQYVAFWFFLGNSTFFCEKFWSYPVINNWNLLAFLGQARWRSDGITGATGSSCCWCQNGCFQK